jgi:Flp pilus assembly pilin Flp
MEVLMKSPKRREEGQTLAEYAVVLAVITLLVIGAFSTLSTAVTALLQQTAGTAF